MQLDDGTPNGSLQKNFNFWIQSAFTNQGALPTWKLYVGTLKWRPMFPGKAAQ